MSSYDRYRYFRLGGKIGIVPSIKLDKKKSDYYEIYRAGHTRLDILSYNYYKDPSYGWLILMANPEYGSMEFEIPNDAIIRIPYPIESTLSEYEQKIARYRDNYDR